MKIFKLSAAILWGLAAAFVCPKCEAVEVKTRHKVNDKQLAAEMDTIIAAAKRNKCTGDDFWILLAIRKAENGRAGREFGILHPRCQRQIQAEPKRSLDIQAGWSAATIVKSRKRWKRAGCPGGEGGFIAFLGNRYCPKKADRQGNINWKRNVRYWFERLAK